MIFSWIMVILYLIIYTLSLPKMCNCRRLSLFTITVSFYLQSWQVCTLASHADVQLGLLHALLPHVRWGGLRDEDSVHSWTSEFFEEIIASLSLNKATVSVVEIDILRFLSSIVPSTWCRHNTVDQITSIKKQEKLSNILLFYFINLAELYWS